MRRILFLAVLAIFALTLIGAAGYGCYTSKACFQNVNWPSGTHTTSETIITCTTVLNKAYKQWDYVYLIVYLKGPDGVVRQVNVGSPLSAPGYTMRLCQGWPAGAGRPGQYSVWAELRERTPTGTVLDTESGGSFQLKYPGS